MEFPDGVYTVLVTPFDYDGNIDYESYDKLIDKQVESNITGIFLHGTTSESPTIILEEKLEIVHHVHKRVHGRKKIIVGVGGNNTSEVLVFAKFCVPYCNGMMVTVPNYNKPSQEGIYQHFCTICMNDELCNVPFVLYNIPSRCGVNMEPETIARVFDNCSNVLAIKEASGSMDQVMKIKSLCNIKIFAGDDALLLPMMALGGSGLISVVGNILPNEIHLVWALCNKNNYNDARILFYSFYDLIKVLFIESNPVPTKYILHAYGFINSDHMRLPLYHITDEDKLNIIKNAYENALIKFKEFNLIYIRFI